MRLFALASVSIAFIISGAAAQNAAPQVTIFTTKDFHQDRALWSNPAYYRNNTPGQLRGMALNIVPYETGGRSAARGSMVRKAPASPVRPILRAPIRSRQRRNSSRHG